jgi:hypothetical protein
MPSLCKRQSLRSTKTFDSDRCLCFQLDKHEVEWGGTIKKGLDSLPLRHIAPKYLRQIPSQATLQTNSDVAPNQFIGIQSSVSNGDGKSVAIESQHLGLVA